MINFFRICSKTDIIRMVWVFLTAVLGLMLLGCGVLYYISAEQFTKQVVIVSIVGVVMLLLSMFFLIFDILEKVRLKNNIFSINGNIIYILMDYDFLIYKTKVLSYGKLYKMFHQNDKMKEITEKLQGILPNYRIKKVLKVPTTDLQVRIYKEGSLNSHYCGETCNDDGILYGNVVKIELSSNAEHFSNLLDHEIGHFILDKNGVAFSSQEKILKRLSSR
jgi:hypothetical protein